MLALVGLDRGLNQWTFYLKNLSIVLHLGNMELRYSCLTKPIGRVSFDKV